MEEGAAAQIDRQRLAVGHGLRHALVRGQADADGDIAVQRHHVADREFAHLLAREGKFKLVEHRGLPVEVFDAAVVVDAR